MHQRDRVPKLDNWSLMLLWDGPLTVFFFSKGDFSLHVRIKSAAAKRGTPSQRFLDLFLGRLCSPIQNSSHFCPICCEINCFFGFSFLSILTERPTQCCEGRIALSLTPKQYLGALWLELMGRKWTLNRAGGVP